MKKQNNMISHSTLADRVFEYISNAILSGEYKSGERLIETDLSEKLGVSRAPIREAFAELEKQGLADSIVRRGTFVRSWTKQDLWEVGVIRSNLEALVAELATPHLAPADVAYLEQIVEEMDKAELEDDVHRQIDLDFKFHDRLVEKCGIERLQRMIDDLKLQVRIFRLLTKGNSSVPYPKQHSPILDALRKGDPRAAREASYSHVMNWMELSMSMLPDKGLLGGLE
jgi:DNA-binding GntR family transcriptional regulator